MTELHEELGKCLVRAGLWSVRETSQSLSRGRRCLQAHSSSHGRSPSVEGRRKEIAKHPKGDSMSRSSWPPSRGCSSIVQKQSPLPEHQQANKGPSRASTRPHRHTSLSLNLQHPLHKDQGLYCSLSKLHLQSQQWESRRREVSRTWPDSTLMDATECPHSPPGSVMEYLPQGPPKKQVCFNLTEDLGDTPPLSNDLVPFLGDPTDEWNEAPCPPAPLVTSSLGQPCNDDGQCHDTPMGGAQPKTHTTPLGQPTAANQARMPGPGQLSNVQIQELVKKHPMGFRLPAAQDDKMGWSNALPSLSHLRQWDFIPDSQFKDTNRHPRGKKRADCGTG